MRLANLTILAAILIGLSPGCVSVLPQEEVPREILQGRAALSLSEQFESVLFSKPQFVSEWDTNNSLPKDPAKNLRYPFAYLWLALDSLPTPAASKLLANTDAILVGAKDFRTPHGIGAVRSTRCYVATLRAEVQLICRTTLIAPV
jgi:hypothetical protein